MSDYIMVKMNKEDALNALVERVRYWTDDEKEIGLFEKMYDDYIWNGCFDGGEFDVMSIVDNDWVNYTAIIRPEDKDFEKVLALYKKDGLGDVSCEDFDYYKINFIESVDDEDNPTMFLVRL